MSRQRRAESRGERLADLVVREVPRYLRDVLDAQTSGESAGMIYRQDGELQTRPVSTSAGDVIVTPAPPSDAEQVIPVHSHPPDSDSRLSAQDYLAFTQQFVATPSPRVDPPQGVVVLFDSADDTATVHGIEPTEAVFEVPLVERYQMAQQVRFFAANTPASALPQRLAGVISTLSDVTRESYATLPYRSADRGQSGGGLLSRLFGDSDDDDTDRPRADTAGESTVGVLDEIREEIEDFDLEPDDDPPEIPEPDPEPSRKPWLPPESMIPTVTNRELRRRGHSYRNFEPLEIHGVIETEDRQAARAALQFIEAGRWNDMLAEVHNTYHPLDGSGGRRSNERERMWRRHPQMLHWVGAWARANHQTNPLRDKPADIPHPPVDGDTEVTFGQPGVTPPGGTAARELR